MHRIVILMLAASVAVAESGVGQQGSDGGGTGGGTGGDTGPGPSGPPSDGGGSQWIFIAFFVLMGFMLWSTFRSQKKEKQKLQQLIANLKMGDQVETIGGLRGEIVRQGEGEFDLKTGGDTTFTVAAGAIKGLVADPAESKKE